MVEAADYHPLSGELSGNVHLQEYFLQGSVLDHSVDKLRERLQGLCDNVEPEPFHDHERNYMIKSQTTSSVMVKACKSLHKQDTPWQMKYIGTPEIGDRSKNIMIRSSVTVATSQDPVSFLTDLGFSLQYEVTLKGKFFRKGRMKIIVAKLTGPSLYDTSKLESASQSHFVEISALASSRDETASDEVRHFSKLLQPIVVLDKVDLRRLLLK